MAGTAPGKFSPDEPVTEQQLELWIDRVFTLYSTNLKDSFYSSVNKNGLETLTIRDGQSSAGTIDDVINLADEQIAEVIADAVNSDPAGFPGGENQDFLQQYHGYGCAERGGL